MAANLFAYFLFSLATAGTPGPNNIMISAAAAGHGVRATVPHALGIATGMALMLLAVGTGLAGPLTENAALHAVLRWVGAGWMLWLAWKIASAGGGAEAGHVRRPPLSFVGAVLFQWINPKAWLIALATAATYTSPDGNLYAEVAVLSLISFLVCLPCVLGWACIGASAGRLLTVPMHRRVFNVSMALLLVASVLPMLAEAPPVPAPR